MPAINQQHHAQSSCIAPVLEAAQRLPGLPEREAARDEKIAALQREVEALRQPKRTPWTPMLAGLAALGLGALDGRAPIRPKR